MFVVSGIVIKRFFKGVIFYWNVFGWYRVIGFGKVLRVVWWVSEVIWVLDCGYGVSVVDIEKFIIVWYFYYYNLKVRIKIVLKEDLDYGRIWLISEGMYWLFELVEVSC